jgi:hypothetical protein
MSTLPIKKVVLYKHGVGYFERSGPIEGDASIELHFRAQEMNDVLKSLTTLDLGNGHIASVSYESTKPLERQLEDIAITLPDENSITALLNQLKGAKVKLEAGSRRFDGVIAGLERTTRREGTQTIETHSLGLLVEGQTLLTFDLIHVSSISLQDEGLKKDIQHLLDVLISGKKKDQKKLTIFAQGPGKREVVASYTVETPVWKTSYRILLGTHMPVLQGWALVDNTQDEDWEQVELTLVAGLPISFVHDLYSPRYKRRPVVQVREEEAYAPPELETAAPDPFAAMDKDMDMAHGGPFAGGMAPVPAPMAKAGRAVPAMASRSRAAAREESVPVQARTVEVGDLFHYEIKNPVTVKRNQSALVPIIQGPFEGKRVAVYNREVREKNPMSAVFFKNTTGMTLEGGPVTVLEDDTYVGEAMLDTMKPAEERLVPYSVELGCLVAIDHKSELLAARTAKIASGSLHLLRYRLAQTIYLVENKTDRKLDLFLEHRFNKGWDLVDTEKPFETTENFYRFRFDVPPRKTVRFVVGERVNDKETFLLESADRDTLKVWVDARYIDEPTLLALEEMVKLSERSRSLAQKIQRREEEQKKIFANQERVRKNLAALGSGPDERTLRERYVAELGKEEDRLKELHDLVEKLKEQKDAAAKELRDKLHELRFETNLG